MAQLFGRLQGGADDYCVVYIEGSRRKGYDGYIEREYENIGAGSVPGVAMQKTMLLNEIKLMELKLHALKAQVESEKPKIKELSSANLYGLLQGSEDISAEDIDAVRIKLKETA